MGNLLTQYSTDKEAARKYLSIVSAFWVSALSFSYIYFLNSSILHTVARERNDSKILQLAAGISILENRYMAQKSALNIDMARNLGFEDDFSKVHFSSESPNVAGNLSLLSDEI